MTSFRKSPNALRAIGLGGLVAGILDISDALLFYGARGISPQRLLQGIAAGILGPSAARGGWESAIFGLSLHFLIAFSAAAVYYVASRRIRMLREKRLASGLLYGLAVFLFMNVIVVPLSAIHRNPKAILVWSVASINAVLAVVLLVGLPIAFLAGRYASKTDSET